jgi:hypothetical protein
MVLSWWLPARDQYFKKVYVELELQVPVFLFNPLLSFLKGSSSSLLIPAERADTIAFAWPRPLESSSRSRGIPLELVPTKGPRGLSCRL